MTLQALDSIAALLGGLGAAGSDQALTFYRGRTLSGRLTYSELGSRVEMLAGFLEHVLKVRAGDRILVLAPNRLEIPVLVLAIMRLGAVVVPLNPTATVDDWSYIARHSGARGVFGTRELNERLRTAQPALQFALELDGLFEEAAKAPLPANPPSEKFGAETAIVLYTSGTTGNPKGVGLSQRNLLRNGWSMALNFKLSRTTQFAVLPLYHAHALGFGLMTALSSGGHLVFTEKLDPFAWCDVIKAESVTYTSVVPSLLPMLLAARVHRDKVPSLKAVLVSSAPLTAALAREFESKTALQLVQGWGLSEYTNFACCLSPELTAAEREALLYAADGTSVGGALTGTEVMVADLDGKPVGEGAVGELCVRGHSLMTAYYREPEATQATLRDGWLRTGDQGLFRLHDGRPVYFVTGRIKEIIIRDGEKYSPLAIEKRLFATVPELEGKLVVVGFAHKGHGEEIGAYLETAALDDETRARLASAVEKLPLEQRPKVVLFGPAPIPRTHTGKIQRRKLQPLFASYVDCRGPLKITSS